MLVDMASLANIVLVGVRGLHSAQRRHGASTAMSSARLASAFRSVRCVDANSPRTINAMSRNK